MSQYPALLPEIAKAVAEILNGEAYSREFVAKRGYNPRRKLSHLEGLTILVVPAAVSSDSFLDRGHRRKTPAVYIGVLERMNAGQGDGIEGDDNASLEQLDGLATLVEEIMDTFLPQPGEERASWRLESGRVLVADTVTVDPAYDLSDMQDKRQFTSVLLVTFTVDQE